MRQDKKTNPRKTPHHFTDAGAWRSGQAGRRNLEEYKAKGGKGAVTHGIFSFLTTGALPAGHEALAADVDVAISEIADDLRGDGPLTGQQKDLLAQLRVVMLVMRLGYAYLIRHGFPKALRVAELLVSYCGRSTRIMSALYPMPRKGEPEGDTLESIAAELGTEQTPA